MKRTTPIPKFFHELFGTYQLLSELLLILFFTFTASVVAAFYTASYWQELAWYQSLVLWLLFLDISGGVVANLSEGTNAHYNLHPKARWIFIAVHVQPLILAALLKSPMSIAITVWLYTIFSASLINSLRTKAYHRLLAGILLATAITTFVLTDVVLPPIITAVYLLYMIKVIYSFSVNHHLEVKNA